ncbi:MAG: hypothetical protein CTY19_13390 [Methylomonas sp.]|nr:MAG: hypothetical protein CTY19_13390 [Methylomonas sp.]
MALTADEAMLAKDFAKNKRPPLQHVLKSKCWAALPSADLLRRSALKKEKIMMPYCESIIGAMPAPNRRSRIAPQLSLFRVMLSFISH